MKTALNDEVCYDQMGPQEVVHLWDPSVGLRAVLVIDNTACGPSIGGVRMAADVGVSEVFRLARAMTLKNAAAGLPHGGGKAGIVADPHTADREALIRAFARRIRHAVDYVPGPDMGTDERCMGWILDEIGRGVGRPRVLGGIPLDELGATGFGLAVCAEVAAPAAGIELDGARVVIEGFGNVGRHAAAFLAERGCRVVGASDSQGAIHNEGGIDVAALTATKLETGRLTAFPDAESIPAEGLFHVPCDILIPAARPDCIHAGNVRGIEAKLILQGANIPATLEAETLLDERGTISVPDFIANAGGVICAAFEHAGSTEAGAFAAIESRIRNNTREVLERAREHAVLPRVAALKLAQDRVLEAQSYRGGA